tara:strand:- start:353 stop:532 length:180 start_codon:yes stop_codon:yes gene_type:complete
MNHDDLERIYTCLAHTIDEVGAARSELFLARLVLLLAHRCGDPDEFEKHIADAVASLDA